MSLRASLVLGTTIVLVSLASLAACGGNVNSGSGDGADGGGGADGGSGEGGGPCSTSPYPGDRACVPGTARANTPIEIQVDAIDKCLECFTAMDPCQVDVSGTTITVSMALRSCKPAGNPVCHAACVLAQTTCKLPALAAGTYNVAVTGQATPAGLPPRTLVVTDDAVATSCKLPRNGNRAEPIDGTKYGTSCSVDSDCAVATVGEVCTPCTCPNLAIAKASSSEYAADYRSRTSECTPDKSGAICAACAPVKATCEVLPDALTGTCKLTPGS